MIDEGTEAKEKKKQQVLKVEVLIKLKTKCGGKKRARIGMTGGYSQKNRLAFNIIYSSFKKCKLTPQ